MTLPGEVDALLGRHLRAWNPSSLLGVSFTAIDAVDGYLECRPSCECHMVTAAQDLTPLAPLGRFDLAVVSNQIENLPKRRGVELLGRLKNLHTHRICLAVCLAQCDGWTRNDLLGLGFRESRELDTGSSVRFFSYDLANYNPKRSWNNARHWANPENFDKYRW